MEKKQQTEVFKNFINSKQAEVSDFLLLLGECADKLEFLEDLLFFRSGEEFNFQFKERSWVFPESWAM